MRAEAVSCLTESKRLTLQTRTLPTDTDDVPDNGVPATRALNPAGN